MPAVALIILLALNLLALAGVLGWLGEPGGSGEAQRLALQLKPEHILLEPELAAARTMAAEPVTDALVAPAEDDTAIAQTAAEDASPDASAAPPPLLCLRWESGTALAVRQLADSLAATGAELQRSTRPGETHSWWVRLPPQGSREQAERSASQLRSQGISDLFIVQDSGPNQHAISLGVFKTEARARVLLEQLRQRGIQKLELKPRQDSIHVLEARFPAAARPAIEDTARAAGLPSHACDPE